MNGTPQHRKYHEHAECKVCEACDERIAQLEAALRKISHTGHEHPDAYVEGAWFAATADLALTPKEPI